MSAVTFRATGRVQGVSYRAFTRRTAASFAVSGWCRNEDDGSVTGRAEGTDADLARFVAALRQGPPGARVDAVEVAPVEPEGARGFTIRD